ncbi:MAG: hypothetical protein HQL63_13300 [Magnetococcales bacterium]|nr:hypothetical protein [Magnetococcales bacterium]MBF0321468.1 hypothetical protein [Magnetococcales bacterium]
MKRLLWTWLALLVVSGWTFIAVGEGVPPPFARVGPVAKPNCAACHAWLESVSKPRPLLAPHNALVLSHGKGTLWCLDCHVSDGREKLRAGGESEVTWNEEDRLCALCHGRNVGKWQAGVHGKRVGSWQGTPRAILRCRVCHDAHQPASRPWLPDPPPPRKRQGTV